jgi:hypothetical protein
MEFCPGAAAPLADCDLLLRQTSEHPLIWPRATSGSASHRRDETIFPFLEIVLKQMTGYQ